MVEMNCYDLNSNNNNKDNHPVTKKRRINRIPSKQAYNQNEKHTANDGYKQQPTYANTDLWNSGIASKQDPYGHFAF